MTHDLDERVALEILGWSYQTFPEGPCPDVKHWYATSPCPNDPADATFRGCLPSFTYVPSLDLVVMKHVQEKWDGTQKARWTNALSGALCERSGGTYSGMYCDLHMIRWYVPGDYSKAALAAISGDAE